MTGISTTLVDTFNFFIRSSAFLLVNRSSVPTLLKRMQSRADGDATVAAAAAVLQHIAKHQPIMFKSHAAELTKALGESASERLAEVALHALSRLVMADDTVKPDKRLAERARHFAERGTPKQSKYAATIIALDTARPTAAEIVVDVSPPTYRFTRLETDARDVLAVSRRAARD